MSRIGGSQVTQQGRKSNQYGSLGPAIHLQKTPRKLSAKLNLVKEPVGPQYKSKASAARRRGNELQEGEEFEQNENVYRRNTTHRKEVEEKRKL